MSKFAHVCSSKLMVIAFSFTWALALSVFQHGTCQEKPVKVLTDNSPQPEDKSLTPTEYVRLGLPSHDRDWVGNDMKIAADALAAIAKKDRTQLPRSESKTSGKVFARIISNDNLEMFKNKSVPVQQRLGSCVTHMDANRLILTTYLDAFQNRAVSDRDMLDVLESTLRVSAVIMDIADEFLPLLDENDPSYPARMKGLDQMKRGLSTVASGAIVTLTESNSYRPKELKRFAGKLKDTLPRLFKILTKDTHEEFSLRLQGFAQDDSMKVMRPELEELIQKLEGK